MVDMLIKCNVGKQERKIRTIVGLAAALGAFKIHNKNWRPLLSAIGLFGLLTAASRYCPINHLLGIRGGQVGYRSVRQMLRRI